MSAADGDRRRYWSDDDKLRIVEESFIGDRQAAATARRHGICRSLLTTWRRQYRNGELGSSRAVSFAPVTVTNAPPPQINSVDPCRSPSAWRRHDRAASGAGWREEGSALDLCA
nr:transposase [Roseovarius azorensis]